MLNNVVLWTAEVEYYTPASDGDGWEVSEDILTIKVSSVSQLAYALSECSYNMRTVCIYGTLESLKDRRFYLDTKSSVTDREQDDIFCLLCDAIAELMKWDNEFRQALIQY